jgi:ATP-dependent helicase/nuclease subunit A
MNTWQRMTASLEQEHQAPAVAETRSAVVSAGAGSGKTRVLAIRYLHLVKERHIQPERILCLTFTKKAAAEMSERIRGMLSQCAEDDQDFAAALASFPNSRVSTLDSFCSDIARNGCARWGVSPDFSVDKDADAESLRSLAIDFMLSRRTDPVVASFLAACGFENAIGALIEFARDRQGLIASTRVLDRDAQDAAIRARLTAAHASLHALLHGGLDLEPGSGSGGRQWRDLAERFAPEAPAATQRDVLEAARAGYMAIAALRRPTGKDEGPSYYNQVGADAKALASIAALACDALLDDSRAGVLAMLREFLGKASESRAASGSLGFSDVASIAVATLATDLRLRDWYKSRYDAIMVDEFQDDNELQKRLLYYVAERRDRTDPDRGAALSPGDLEPGVLFFVGDEKQSVYAFRGADVTVFRGLSQELACAAGGLGEHHLEVNWRSEPALIDFFNQTFSRIMPSPADHGAQDFEARFSGLRAGPGTPDVMPVVRYLESNEPDDDTFLPSAESEAWHIAELVRSLVDGGELVTGKDDKGEKSARPCTFDDIAVLFKSTASQNTVERYFRLFHIPYTAVSSAGLYAESILGDLYAMLRLAVYPDDRLAFATMLRGPFARLSDRAVFLALSPGAQGSQGLMGFDESMLPPDDAARFEAARATWRGVRALADRAPLCRLVEYLWYDRGLRWNVLKDRAASSFLEHFDYAWSMAVSADARGERLVDLVAAIEPSIGQLERYDESVLRESSRGVSLLTVHLSKGLEFPVVILPSLEAKGRNTIRSPIAQSREFGVSARLLDEGGEPRDPVAELASSILKLERGTGAEAMDESLAETARLFYVACTRAISRLYLIGKVPRSEDAAGRSFRGLFLRAWPWAGPKSAGDEEFLSDRPEDAPGILGIEYVQPRTKAEYARRAGGDHENAHTRAAASAEAPATAVTARRGRMSVTAAAERLAALVGQAAALPAADIGPATDTGLPEADFGTLCHQFVEAMLIDPDAMPAPHGPVAATLAGIAPAHARRATDEAIRLAKGFVLAERGLQARMARRAALDHTPGALFEIEYPFVWRGDIILTGAMDLVYGDEHGVFVVDFKTDRRFDPERHAFQLGIYRDAAASLFGVPARAFLFYLYTGTEHEIVAAPDQFDLAAYLTE